MKKYIYSLDIVFGISTLFVSIWFYIMSLGFDEVTADGSVNEGFFPKILAVSLAILSVLLILKGIKKPEKYFDFKSKTKKEKKTFFSIVIAFFIYILAWPYVNFMIQTMLLILYVGYTLEMNKKFLIPFSIVMSVGLYYLFTIGFSILL